jgi:hypothetical protein
MKMEAVWPFETLVSDQIYYAASRPVWLPLSDAQFRANAVVRQHCPPKRRYPTTSLHGVTAQKTAT